jgi:hypothetical protein
MSNLEKIGVLISIIVVLYFLIFKIETMDAIDTILITSIILLLPYFCYVKWQEYTMAVYKSVFPEDEGDEKNQSLKEEQEESLSLWEWYDNFICHFHYRTGYSTTHNFDEYIKLKPILEKELELERAQILGCLVISRIVTHLAVLLGYLIAILMWFEPDIGYLSLLFPIGLWLVSIIFMWLLIYVLRHLIFLIGI